MSVVGTAKVLKGTQRSTEDEDGVREYRATYLVVTDSNQDGADAVLAASGLPRRTTTYNVGNENNPAATVRSRIPRQVNGSPQHWNVDVTWSTETPDPGDGEEGDQDPLNQPAVVTFGFNKFRVVALGEEETPLTNANGEAFDPPPMKDNSRPTLQVQRNEKTFDPLLAIEFQDAVNDGPWIGAEERQVKVQGIDATKELDPRDPTSKFWRVTYNFEFARDNWDIKLLHTGTYYIVAGTTEEISFKTDTGQPRIGLLTTGGDRLAKGAPENFREFRVYPEKTFGELGIDETLGLNK